MPEAAPHAPTKKIAAFEGLRGVLALTVCLGHYGLNHVTERFGVNVLKQLAVFVFFALSGFVLSRAYYFGRRAFRDLALSRFARLYPLHLATTLWCLAMALLARKPIDPLNTAATLLLLHNLGLPGAGWTMNFPSWSISVEMVLSLAFYFVARRRSPPFVASLMIVGMICAAIWASTDLDPFKNVCGFNVGLVCGVGGFAIGVASYVLYTDQSDRFDRFAPLAPAALAATLGFMLAPLDWFNGAGAIFAAATMLSLILLPFNDRSSVLSTRPMIYLGAISYSIYLIHIPMLLTADAIFGDEAMKGSLSKLALLCATLAASALCHRYFEMPAQAAILNRFARRGDRPASEALPFR